MPSPQRWKFTQLAGDRFTFSLEGASAPHGRPRKGAVVTDGYQLRHSVTYYPGRARPTRHIFGEKHDDWQLKGRWMDRELGPGGANAKLAFVKQFIAAGVACAIEWGNIGAWTGLLTGVVPERESPAQIAYTLDLCIDSDDTLPAPQVIVRAPNPVDDVAALLDLVGPVNPQRPNDIEFPTPFLDSLDDLITQITSFTGAIVNVANDIDNFQTARSSELNRLRGGIGQLSTALATMNSTLDDGSTDTAVERASAHSQTRWAEEREASRANVLAMLALLADLDGQAEEALRGRTQKTARAVSGDSWESLARQHYGGSGKADALRQANGARYGAQPVAGKTIHVPKP